MAYRGILLDLFGTLVHFDPARLPEVTVGERRLRSTLGALAPMLAEWVPEVSPAEFFDALRRVSEEMARARAADHVERPSRERFRRALERVGCGDSVSAEASVHLSRAHMALLARATVLPAGHRELVERLRTRHRLALVSNFDDTGTAYAVLVRHDLARHLDAVVVSEALGLRKPHPAPVRAALGALEVDAAEALFVGDTLAEDVAAAHAAGVDAVWIDAAGAGVPPGAPAPRWVVRALPEIAALPGLHR